MVELPWGLQWGAKDRLENECKIGYELHDILNLVRTLKIFTCHTNLVPPSLLGAVALHAWECHLFKSRTGSYRKSYCRTQTIRGGYLNEM